MIGHFVPDIARSERINTLSEQPLPLKAPDLIIADGVYHHATVFLHIPEATVDTKNLSASPNSLTMLAEAHDQGETRKGAFSHPQQPSHTSHQPLHCPSDNSDNYRDKPRDPQSAQDKPFHKSPPTTPQPPRSMPPDT